MVAYFSLGTHLQNQQKTLIESLMLNQNKNAAASFSLSKDDNPSGTQRTGCGYRMVAQFSLGTHPQNQQKTLNRIANINLESKCCCFFFTIAPDSEIPSYLFSLIPHFNITKILFRTGGEIKFEGESKHIIDSTQELQTPLDFSFNLYMKQKKQVQSQQMHFEEAVPPTPTPILCTVLYLLHSTEYVSIILLEPSYSGKPCQCP